MSKAARRAFRDRLAENARKQGLRLEGPKVSDRQWRNIVRTLVHPTRAMRRGFK